VPRPKLSAEVEQEASLEKELISLIKTHAVLRQSFWKDFIEILGKSSF
jgi:hypothetical protein